MQKWFRHQWVLLLVFRSNFVSWFKKLREKKSSYSPASWVDARPTLDEYADDQIKTLLAATQAYRKAKADPDAFVEHYFSAKIAPRPHKDSWISEKPWWVNLDSVSAQREEENE